MALDYIRVTYPEPHATRGRQMLAAHPELRSLAGPDAWSAVWAVALVAAQMALALVVGGLRWYVWLPCAYIAGATIDHALWALIHETAHNLVFRWRAGNRLVALLANIPLVFPGAIAFCKYHLLHHRHMGDLELDAGVPGPVEASVIGRSGVMKGIWLAGTFLVQGVVRPHRMTRIRMIDGWTAMNFVFQIACMAALVRFAGWDAFVYLLGSSILAIGLHPLGARWVQEHFALVPGQETYSYYGPLNKLSFNVGYHNEHHDLPSVPWNKLPRLKRLAPEMYESLIWHRSYVRLFWRFLSDPNLSLFSRITRENRAGVPVEQAV